MHSRPVRPRPPHLSPGVQGSVRDICPKCLASQTMTNRRLYLRVWQGHALVAGPGRSGHVVPDAPSISDLYSMPSADELILEANAGRCGDSGRTNNMRTRLPTRPCVGLLTGRHNNGRMAGTGRQQPYCLRHACVITTITADLCDTRPRAEPIGRLTRLPSLQPLRRQGASHPMRPAAFPSHTGLYAPAKGTRERRGRGAKNGRSRRSAVAARDVVALRPV